MSDATTRPPVIERWTKDLEIPVQKTEKIFLLADRNTNDFVAINNQGTVVAMLRDYYNMGGEPDIRRCLEGNDNLVPLLYDIHKRMQKYFPNSPLSMRVLQNDLIVSVGTTFNPEEAMDRLDRFDDDWWLDKSLALDSSTSIYVRVEYL